MSIRSWHGVALFIVAGALAADAALAGATVGYLKIEKKIPERRTMAPLFMGADASPTLRELIATLDGAAARGEDLAGLVIRLSEAQLNRTQVEELAAAIGRMRDAGKKVHLFSENYGPGELALGAACDEALIQTGGSVSLPGLYMEEMYLADTLRWAGAVPDFVQIGDYKGASEMMANSRPSPQWDQNINGLLDGLYGAMRQQFKAGRGLSDQELDQAMSALAFADARPAIEHRLIDAEIDRLDLDEHLAGVYGRDFAWDTSLAPRDKGDALQSMGMFEAFGQIMEAMQGSQRTTTRDTIAVLHIDGAIVDGKSSGGGPLGGGPSVGALTVRDALRQIENDDNVKGLLIRVNSPGGSAVASENIWQGVRRVAQKKRVWTSVGSMAASGGYYIAVSGEKIYVDPSSIVGSIGVVGGKLAMGGVYEKLKVNVVSRARGPMASLMASVEPWSSEQRGYIKARMVETYDLFTKRVTAGRPGIDLAKTAEGRLFTGEASIGLKMADEIGGIDRALADMADGLDLAAGEYDVLDYPAPMGLEELLQNGLGFGATAPVSGAVQEAARALLGAPALEQIGVSVRAMLELRREPVVLVAPSVLIFK